MHNLTYDKFVQELKNEVDYHSVNGTDYRKKTSILSLQVAIKANQVNLFFDEEKTRHYVDDQLRSVDSERKKDVAKMLNMVARHLNMQHELINNENLQKHVNQVFRKRLNSA